MNSSQLSFHVQLLKTPQNWRRGREGSCEKESEDGDRRGEEMQIDFCFPSFQKATDGEEYGEEDPTNNGCGGTVTIWAWVPP